MSQVTTIHDLERLAYGTEFTKYLTKADEPWLVTSTGMYNAIYGAYVWMNINMEANIFGLLPKYPWDNSGVRIIKDYSGDAGGTNIDKFGGTPDAGVIAETRKPDLEVFDVKPKLLQYSFEVGYIANFLAAKAKDDNWGNLSQQRLFGGVQFKEKLNKNIGADEEDLATAAGVDRVARTSFELLDVIVSSKAERDAVNSTDSAWYDPWVTGVVDRDTVTTWDSTVKSAGTLVTANGVLTDTLLRETPLAIHEAAGNFPTVAITSQTTMSEIEGQYNNQIQYNILGESMVQLDVNGIQTFRGHGAGMHVTTVYNIPFIPTKDAPKDKDDTTEIGRIIYLDTSDHEGFGVPRIGMQVAKPVSYFEAGEQTPTWPFATGAWSEKGVYALMGEVIARHFKSHGKIRDIRK